MPVGESSLYLPLPVLATVIGKELDVVVLPSASYAFVVSRWLPS